VRGNFITTMVSQVEETLHHLVHKIVQYNMGYLYGYQQDGFDDYRKHE
jgi:hypothetical protein